MKVIILYISLLFLFPVNNVVGQCLENGDFAEWCGSNGNNCGDPTFFSPCVPNWFISHGSPQIAEPGGGDQNNYAFMWSHNSVGEGIFANYNFQQGQPYKIRVRVLSNGESGDFRMYATTGLAERRTCPNTSIQVPTTSQQIAIINSLTTTYQEFLISFTANANYSQVQIYPFTTRTTGLQINALVDYVFVCLDTCLATKNFNSGTVPVGTTEAGYIYAGSSAGSGGSGTVTVSPSSSTSFIASTEIGLLTECSVSVSGSGEFSAIIVPCDSGVSRIGQFNGKRLKHYDELMRAYKKTSVPAPTNPEKITVYPNPVRKEISADIYTDAGDRVQINLLNSQGVVVKKISQALNPGSGLKHLQVDVSKLPAGIYFLQVISKKGTTVKKVEKME
jgi:hypothetical protein